MFDTRGPVGRAFGMLETYGLRRGGRVVARKIVGRLYARTAYLVGGKTLVPASALPLAGDDEMEVRQASRQDVLDAARSGHARRRACAYLDRGYACALGLVGGEPAAWCWWTDHRHPEHDQLAFFGVQLAPGEAWCFQNHVLPPYRGNGRAARFVRGVEGLLSLCGLRRSLGYVDADNLPARWMYATCGWHPIRTVEARYVLALVGVSGGRLVVRNRAPRTTVTFSYRPISAPGRP
jgi:GNAT superfamily N-acetyltransferase